MQEPPWRLSSRESGKRRISTIRPPTNLEAGMGRKVIGYLEQAGSSPASRLSAACNPILLIRPPCLCEWAEEVNGYPSKGRQGLSQRGWNPATLERACTRSSQYALHLPADEVICQPKTWRNSANTDGRGMSVTRHGNSNINSGGSRY